MKITTIKPFLSLCLAGCLTFMLPSCSDSNAEPEPPKPTIEVQLKSNATVSNYLADKDGRALYYFVNDAALVSNCAGGCAAIWPAFNVESLTKDNVGTGLEFSDFTSITTGGKKQLAYKGKPLYYYAPAVNGVNTPEAAGLTNGENVGGIWFTAKPDYTIMLTSAQLVGNDGKNYTSAYVEGNGKTTFFTDAKGVTLYTFKNDRKDDNNFTAADFSNNNVWPIYETDKIVVPSSLDKTLFGSITVAGRKQLTYKGWPLYYFGQDGKVPGATKGVSVPTPGVWPVAVKDVAPAQP